MVLWRIPHVYLNPLDFCRFGGYFKDRVYTPRQDTLKAWKLAIRREIRKIIQNAVVSALLTTLCVVLMVVMSKNGPGDLEQWCYLKALCVFLIFWTHLKCSLFTKKLEYCSLTNYISASWNQDKSVNLAFWWNSTNLFHRTAWTTVIFQTCISLTRKSIKVGKYQHFLYFCACLTYSITRMTCL